MKEMKDNRKVKDNHQQGIERIKMRKGEMDVGQNACMKDGWDHKRKHDGKKGMKSKEHHSSHYKK